MPWFSPRRRMTHNIFIFFILLIFLLLDFYLFSSNQLIEPQNEIIDRWKSNSFERRDYNSSSSYKPIIFIGGMPRSGTTLMRAILDSHPSIRCGEETRVIPSILRMRAGWKTSPFEWNRLLAGGMTEAILDSAVRAFVYEVIIHHSQSADVLCDKDPFVLKYAAYTSTLFPNAKFLLLIRDARAVIHSVITRKVAITGFSLTDYRQNFKIWNKVIESMYDQCRQIGPKQCLMVYYEQLVLQPKKTIENILRYLDLPWNDNVLHHEELIGKKISLSKTEFSSDQVIKPINLEALTKWVDHLPKDVKQELDTLAPMLKKLGYDIKSDTPSYGTADQLVLNNMNQLKQNEEFWNAKVKIYARQSPNVTTRILSK